MQQITIAIILLIFLLEVTLSALNYRNRLKPIPENVSDVYDKEEYRKWLDYTMESHRLSMAARVIDTSVLIAFLLSGFFPYIADIASSVTSDRKLQTLAFFGIYMIVSYIIGIGFRVYQTFSIEERYGFNKSTVRTFILDQIKSLALAIVIGGPLGYLLLSMYLSMGNEFILYSWLLFMALSLIINLLYTRVFIRLFNRLTPLPDGELKEKIEALASKTGYGIKGISVMDASKRSSRLNAFFSGFGRFKQIVLFDTLVGKLSADETVAVLAHEIGHAKHRDVLKNFLLSAVQTVVFLALLTFFLSSGDFSMAFGFSDVHLGFAILLFGILMEPLGIILGIPLSAISRKAEYKADRFSAESCGKEPMTKALKVLAKENFSNLTPHPLVVIMTYSHPPISDRIAAISAVERKDIPE
jgi:STE24 endopeptidase